MASEVNGATAAGMGVSVLVFDEQYTVAPHWQVHCNHDGTRANLQIRKQRRDQLATVVEKLGVTPEGEGAQLAQRHRARGVGNDSKGSGDFQIGRAHV